MPAKGQTALYRPVPGDFDETFIRIGWSDIEDHYRAHAITIRKWIDRRNFVRRSEGLPSLEQARSMWVQFNGAAQAPKRIAEGKARKSASRYVAGRTNRVLRWPKRQPAFWDFGLLPGIAVAPLEKPRRAFITTDRAAAVIEQEAKIITASQDFLAGMARAAEVVREQGAKL